MAINDGLSIIKTSADATGASLELLKRRSLYALVASNDVLGELVFAGSDGTVARNAAKIQVTVDTTPGASDMPGRMVFYTTPNGSTTLTEALRIDNAQNMIIANGKRIETDEVRARDSGGLALYDDGGNGIFIEDGGAIGIGTTSPLFKVHIDSDTVQTAVHIAAHGGVGVPGEGAIILAGSRGTHASPTATQATDVIGAIYFQGWDTARSSGAAIKAIAGDEWGTSGDTTDDPTDLVFYTVPNGSGTLTERLRITRAGDVGIGVDTPLFNLHIDSDTTQTALHIAAHGGVGTPGEGSILLYGSRGTHASPTATQSGDTLGAIYFQGFDTARSSGAKIAAIASDEWGTAGDTSDNPTDLVFYTVPNGSDTLTERMRITKGGDVGIGVSSPSFQMHIDSDTTQTAVHVAAHGGTDTPGEGAILLYGSRGTHASPTATQATDVIGAIYFQGYDTARSNGAKIYAIAPAEWGTAGDTTDDPTDIRFATVPDGSNTLTDRLTITSEGLVSIAEMAPTTALFQVGPGASTSLLGIMVDMPASTTSHGVQVQYNGTSYMRLSAQSAANQLSFQSVNLGNNAACINLLLGRNTNAGAEGPVAGALRWLRADGTARYSWLDAGSLVRFHTAAPTGSSGTPTVADTAGSVLGDQTSWYTEKNVGRRVTDTETALNRIRALAVHEFQYKESGYQDASGKPQTFTGLVGYDRSDWFLKNCGPQQLPALNEITLFGTFALALQEIAKRLEKMEWDKSH